jgi:hypothetical protein
MERPLILHVDCLDRDDVHLRRFRDSVRLGNGCVDRLRRKLGTRCTKLLLCSREVSRVDPVCSVAQHAAENLGCSRSPARKETDVLALYPTILSGPFFSDWVCGKTFTLSVVSRCTCWPRRYSSRLAVRWANCRCAPAMALSLAVTPTATSKTVLGNRFAADARVLMVVAQVSGAVAQGSGVCARIAAQDVARKNQRAICVVRELRVIRAPLLEIALFRTVSTSENTVILHCVQDDDPIGIRGRKAHPVLVVIPEGNLRLFLLYTICESALYAYSGVLERAACIRAAAEAF